MKDRKTVQTSLSGIANKANTQPTHRFRNLYRELNEELFLDSWKRIRKNAASGVDGISAKAYGKELEKNISDLTDRLKRKAYRAKLVRRKYIPKGNGKRRPLGIPAIDDKLAQLGATRILNAIYEQDFMRCSYGYRPHIGARDAVAKLTTKLQFGNYQYVVDADIRGFFENIDHDLLLEMLEQRIDDKAFLRLIRKWLRAGILEEDGKTVIRPGAGTPQGGIVSPILANIYLHHVLDVWFHRQVLKRCRGEACLIRYADDFVCGFEHREDAEFFVEALKERLAQFKLELAEEKTAIHEFRRTRPENRFDFLGFEFYWSRDKKGRPHLKKRTSRKKLRSSLEDFTSWIRTHRSVPIRELFRKLNSKLRGYYNYYGVIDNSPSLWTFYYEVVSRLRKWLSRRSQRGKVNWDRMNRLVKKFNLEKPRINQRPWRSKRKTVCVY